MAKRQAEAAAQAGSVTNVPASTSSGSSSTYTQPTSDNHSNIHEVHGDLIPQGPKNTHFYMSGQLDTTRIGRDVQRLLEEVISHLTSVDGAQVEAFLARTEREIAGRLVTASCADCF